MLGDIWCYPNNQNSRFISQPLEINVSNEQRHLANFEIIHQLSIKLFHAKNDSNFSDFPSLKPKLLLPLSICKNQTSVELISARDIFLLYIICAIYISRNVLIMARQAYKIWILVHCNKTSNFIVYSKVNLLFVL